MPIHEFHCPDCDKLFEELVRDASAKPAVACPNCGGRNAARQFSVFATRNGPIAREQSSAGGCGRCGDPQGPCSR